MTLDEIDRFTYELDAWIERHAYNATPAKLGEAVRILDGLAYETRRRHSKNTYARNLADRIAGLRHRIAVGSTFA